MPSTQGNADSGRPAIIVDRRRDDRFISDNCWIDPTGWIHASGYWRILNLTGELRGAVGERSWSPAEAVHVVWGSSA